jgi:CysZ protein
MLPGTFMIDAALAAAEQIFTKPFRAVFWKSLGLTLLLLIFFAAGLGQLLAAMIPVSTGWLATFLHIAAGFGLVIGITFLVTPVSFVVAGFYFDELAGHAEEAIAGPAGRGRPMELTPAIWIGLKFAALSLGVNIIALVLLLVPGVNAIAFFGANAYLLGRGYFELAALRFLPFEQVQTLRRTYQVRIFIAGCLAAGLLALPLANLLTPLFASALLVRVAYPLVARGGSRAQAIR